MTDSSIIQQARDVLGKWRKEAREGRWHFAYMVPSSKNLGTIDGDMERAEFYVASDVTSEDARLVVGTAGNPDLLDAIDGLLAATAGGLAQGFKSYPGFTYAERIAAAIIAADERMTS
ncbi:hypothetical protein [Curtobacterium sp. MCBD17_021]|uniref:hypothetical protein n=1 Tax=Curtobacterium sp. MCBD17_021 TaxID=2175665 RepID=UPI000DA7FD51|nr:hypothetical protein [Curtobacterium sp. MCBD17_021]PZE66921.1 hypothetical protein DEI83_06325 [Curtobacterium sp. MCBD17_021]